MKIIIISIFSASMILLSCTTGKYVSEFKEIKKGIDTLMIFPVDIKIKTVDFYKKQFSDPNLESTVKTDIKNKINEVLKGKYIVLNTDVNDSLVMADLLLLGDIIDNKENPINNTQVPASYISIKNKVKERYSLLLIVRAQYCVNFPENTNTLWIDPVINTYIYQYVFMVDNLQQKIIYFKKTKTLGNVSIKSSVEQITLESLKSIYYK